MTPQADRIRAALSKEPRLLLDLVLSLQEDTPPILRPWEPDLTPSDSFLAVRRTLMGDPLVIVRPEHPGFRGPWMVSPHTPIGNPELEFQLRQAAQGHDGPRAYKAVLERVDFILSKHDYIALNHTFPDILLGPWLQSAPDRWARKLKVFDSRMCPEFEVTALNNGLWRIFREPGDVVHDHTDNLETAKLAADKMLIALGYNLARPTSFGSEYSPNPNKGFTQPPNWHCP